MDVELLLVNGTVVDPARKIHGKRDIAIADGKIVDLEEELSAQDLPRNKRIDLSGKIVTPGLIDLHVHVYEGVSHYGIDVDSTCLSRGVTTVLDAGSAGALTFSGFRRLVIENARTDVYALLNIASQGMISPDVGELENIRYIDVDRAVRTCAENEDTVLGIKVRLSPNVVGRNAPEALDRAREIANAAGLPLMVHANGSEIPLKRIFGQMNPGDILTHCFHGRSNGILDERGKVKPEVRDALKKGLLFDLGHGMGSFSFRVARQAFNQDILPDTISSDLHTASLPAVYDLSTTKRPHSGRRNFWAAREIWVPCVWEP
jgi:dihydroorotase